MLQVSLHKIAIHAPIGLYEEEKIHGNDFEIDVDVFFREEDGEQHFVDYVILHQVVAGRFALPADLLEEVVRDIWQDIKERFPFTERIRVCVRKLYPPLNGQVAYSQVCLDK